MRKIIKLLIVCLFLSSCSKDNDFQNGQDIESNRADSSFTIAKELYLWNSEIAERKEFDPSRFATPIDLLLEFRKYSPKNQAGIPVDKWSFAIEKETWNNLLQGNTVDFGAVFKFIGKKDLRVALVQENSSAAKSKLRRGLQILTINGIKAEVSNSAELSREITESSELQLSYLDPVSGIEQKNTLSRFYYVIEAVADPKYFESGNKKVGYLNISTFISSTKDRLPEIFDDFRSNSIDGLIIDLRYNGGGLTGVMEYLANMLVPKAGVGKTMYKIKHNANYSAFNSTTFFTPSDQRLDLKTIYFIVSQNTASSSEMLINSLKPYINTVLIGKETHGKLVGMYTVSFHDYILAPVSFKTFNANDESLEGQGFLPDFDLGDDVSNDFDQNENCIAAALYHYQNGAFPAGKDQNKKTPVEQMLYSNEMIPFAIRENSFNIKRK